MPLPRLSRRNPSVRGSRVAPAVGRPSRPRTGLRCRCGRWSRSSTRSPNWDAGGGCRAATRARSTAAGSGRRSPRSAISPGAHRSSEDGRDAQTVGLRLRSTHGSRRVFVADDVGEVPTRPRPDDLVLERLAVGEPGRQEFERRCDLIPPALRQQGAEQRYLGHFASSRPQPYAPPATPIPTSPPCSNSGASAPIAFVSGLWLGRGARIRPQASIADKLFLGGRGERH